MGDELKPGDVVVLNSGGPRMTVTGIGANDVAVSWATRHQSKPDEHDGRVNHGRFPRVTLTKVTA